MKLELLENIPDFLIERGLFGWCDETKLPFSFTSDSKLRSNHIEDWFQFSSIVEYLDTVERAKSLCVVISSDICSLDIDHCVNHPFDKSEISTFALELIEFFGQYTEFSFSGTGIRIWFEQRIHSFDRESFYIKNKNVEFYCRAQNSPRYLTLTGCKIQDKKKKEVDIDTFLTRWMKREQTRITLNEVYANVTDVKSLYSIIFSDSRLSSLWYRSMCVMDDESSKDYFLIRSIFEKIQCDPKFLLNEILKSHYFETKDQPHKDKWMRNNFRYYWSIVKKIINV